MLSACIAVAVVISILLTIIIIWFLRHKQYKYTTIGRVKGGDNDDPCSTCMDDIMKDINSGNIENLINASYGQQVPDNAKYVTCYLKALRWDTEPNKRITILTMILLNDKSPATLTLPVWKILVSDVDFIRLCIASTDAKLPAIDGFANANVTYNNFTETCIEYMVYRCCRYHEQLLELKQKLQTRRDPALLKVFWDTVVNASRWFSIEPSYIENMCNLISIIQAEISPINDANAFIVSGLYMNIFGINSFKSSMSS